MGQAAVPSSLHRHLRLIRLLVVLTAAFAALPIPRHAEAAPKFAAIAVDARTGKVLFARDADGKRHPASLTKVMTLYVLFQELRAGRYTLDSPLTVSKRAAGMAPSKIGFKPGQTIRVEDAIKALVTKSANDVAAAVAENIAGSESAFAQRMTKVARSLGMSRTTFVNASGLPNPAQITTARDMATLSLRIQRDFPEYYRYFSLPSFTYRGKVIRTHNKLIGRFEGTDGIKTGYIRASGFNLMASVKRGEKKIIGVVMGGKSGASRNSYMMSMLSEHLPKCKAGKVIAAAVGGATAPDETVLASAKAPKPKGQAGSASRASDRVMADVADDPAPPEQGDEESAEEASAAGTVEGADGTLTLADVIAQTTSPANAAEAIAEPDDPKAVKKQPDDKLPFAVKTGEQPSAWEGQVLVASQNANWTIQVGAFPDKRSAQEQLKLARRTNLDLLANKPAMTVTVQKGQETIYRANFSGFSEDDARAACRELVLRSIGCIVLVPHS